MCKGPSRDLFNVRVPYDCLSKAKENSKFDASLPI